MPQSQVVTKLVTALVKSQAEFKPIPKSKTGQEGNRKFKYADLADVVNMVAPILSKNGIFLSQPIVVDNGVLRQTTRLQLEDEYIQTDGIKLSDDTPGKNLGISVTYARRIDLNGLLGIAPDEDLDAPDLKPSGSTYTSPVPTTKTTTVPGTTSTTGEATDFIYGANSNLGRTATQVNPEITDADLPSFDTPIPYEEPLSKDAQAVADHLATFVPLTEKRNTEIQNRLKELVANKTVGRRDLSFFLEDQHDGKKQFDVDAKQWEATIAKIESAVADGSIKTLLKTKKGA